MYKTVLNYPKDKIYVINPFYHIDSGKIDHDKLDELSQLLYVNGQRGDHELVANSLNNHGGVIKERIIQFLDNKDMRKGIVKIGDIITPLYEKRINPHPYFGSITEEQFSQLRGIIGIEFEDGILIVDGNYRVVVYYNTGYPATFHIY